jgi:hypothetical protein
MKRSYRGRTDTYYSLDKNYYHSYEDSDEEWVDRNYSKNHDSDLEFEYEPEKCSKKSGRRSPSSGVVIPVLPPEVFNLISTQVWNQCLALVDLLNWHATCVNFWDEYLNFSDEKMLAFGAEKRKKNHELLKKTFQSKYKDNIIDFARYEASIHMCMKVKERIVSLDNDYMESKVVLSKQRHYQLKGWDTWKGMKFEDDELHRDSLYILRNIVHPRLLFRYGWELSFVNHQDGLYLDEEEYFYFPWFNIPLTSDFSCYLETLLLRYFPGRR